MRVAWRQLHCISGDIGVIVHGPRGCGHDFSLPTTRGERLSAACTDMTETQVVMGGETCLAEKIDALFKKSRPEAIFVLGTCVSELIGDDVRKIAALAEARLGVPVVALPTSGLAGMEARDPRALGLTALAERVMKPGRRCGRTVNFIGQSWPSDARLEAELGRRLAALDVRLQSVLTGSPTLAQLRKAPAAALNVVALSEHSRGFGELLEARFGQPYILVPSDPGIGSTSRFFRAILERLGAGRSRLAVVEGWDRKESAKLRAEHPGLAGRTVGLVWRRPNWDRVAPFAELGLDVTVLTAEAPSPQDEAERRRLGVRLERRDPAASEGWSRFELLYAEEPAWPGPASHRPNRHMRPLSCFPLYEGMRALALELETELGSGFFRSYGSYLA